MGPHSPPLKMGAIDGSPGVSRAEGATPAGLLFPGRRYKGSPSSATPKGCSMSSRWRNLTPSPTKIVAWANKSGADVDATIHQLVIKLVFEKPTDEATWFNMHARLCRKMMEHVSLDVRDKNLTDRERFVNSSFGSTCPLGSRPTSKGLVGDGRS